VIDSTGQLRHPHMSAAITSSATSLPPAVKTSMPQQQYQGPPKERMEMPPQSIAVSLIFHPLSTIIQI